MNLTTFIDCDFVSPFRAQLIPVENLDQALAVLGEGSVEDIISWDQILNDIIAGSVSLALWRVQYRFRYVLRKNFHSRNGGTIITRSNPASYCPSFDQRKLYSRNICSRFQ